MSQPKTFTDLLQTGLHAIDTAAAWEAYYAAMSPWISDDDSEIRSSALERLCTAVYWCEGSYEDDYVSLVPRVEWLLGCVDSTAKIYPDIIGAFLFHMRFSFPYGAAAVPVRAWLQNLVDTDHTYKNIARGTLVVNARIPPSEEDERAYYKNLLTLLDDASDYVRACAAHAIGGVNDETGLSVPELFKLIGEKELIRPGIAGPFWSGGEFDYWEPDDFDGVKPIIWMMDLLENRAEFTQHNMPFNDIAFHLHELSAGSPDVVRRMIKNGELGLALETACEIRGRVEGMEAVLRELGGTYGLPSARRHLAHHYGVLHADADGSFVKRTQISGAERAIAFAIRYGDPKDWIESVILHAPKGGPLFTQAQAWEMIDELTPPEKRGALDYPYLQFDKTIPPEPYVLGDTTMFRFQDHINIEIIRRDGSSADDKDSIERIDIGAPRLGQFDVDQKV